MKVNTSVVPVIIIAVVIPFFSYASPNAEGTDKPLVATVESISDKPDAPEEIEKIEVIGTIPSSLLYKRVVAARRDFYDLFNQITDKREYKMFCYMEPKLGSNIRKLKCEPEYYRETRRKLAQTLSGGMIGSMPAVVPENWVKADAKKKMDEAYAYMHKLVQENDQLWLAYQRVVATTKDYETRKASE